MTAIIAALIPALFKTIGYFIDKSNATKEQKEYYLKFISTYNKMGNSSKIQHDDIKNQLDDLKDK